MHPATAITFTCMVGVLFASTAFIGTIGFIGNFSAQVDVGKQGGFP